MISFSADELSTQKMHQLLLGSVGPRPICFASTIDAQGNRNLAPFSFFNVFSAAPPILVFSPARSGRTGESKHTYQNVLEVPEVVINIVNYAMVEQMSLASSPYAKGVDEFVKAGFTPIASETVAPFRVKESPVQFECHVNQVIELGQQGGAGNLIICQVKKIHVNEAFMNEQGNIDQNKIDLVARMGGDWYCRANGEALFELVKPLTVCGIGVDALPDHIKNSHRLTGNELGKLGNLEAVPDAEFMYELKNKYEGQDAIEAAKTLLAANQAKEALALLW
jgi:flavin reductase (DIM6/NTAB) family NADH-FMN oxidoreductase RutF